MLYIILGLVILTMGLIIQMSNNKKFENIKSTYTYTEGTIIELQRVRRKMSKRYPVIRFYTSDGQEKMYKSRICVSRGTYSIGDKIDVYYDPNDPDSIKIYFTPVIRHLPIILCGIWSFLLIIIGVFFLSIGS